MKLIAFLKQAPNQNMTARELADLALEMGYDGYDLPLRPGYPVNPANVRTALPEAVKVMRQSNLIVGMLTAGGDFLQASDPTAEPIFATMAETGVRLIKLGYWRYDPAKDQYWQRVEQIHADLARWEKLAAKYNVQVCVHTHAGMLGRNVSEVMHLIRGFDPRRVGAYIDPAHLVAEGEPFSAAVGIAAEYLCAVGVKDVDLQKQTVNGHGKMAASFRIGCGLGWVDWTDVFATLARTKFDGMLSYHGLMDPNTYAAGKDWRAEIRREIGVIKDAMARASK